MSTHDGMTDVIRIRIEPGKKEALTELYRARGTNVSQAARDFFDAELEAAANPLDRFDAIMAAVDEKLDAYAAPEPTVDDVVAYVEKVREARSRDLVA